MKRGQHTLPLFVDGIRMMANALSLTPFQVLRHSRGGKKGPVYRMTLADKRYLEELRADPPTRQLRRQFERLANKPYRNDEPRLF